MDDFKWRHFAGDVILHGVRWYCKYGITYRDLAEMMQERGVEVDELTRGMFYPPKHNIVYGFSIIIKTFRPVQPRDSSMSIAENYRGRCVFCWSGQGWSASRIPVSW